MNGIEGDDGKIGLADAIILIALFIAYLTYLFIMAKKKSLKKLKAQSKKNLTVILLQKNLQKKQLGH